MDKPERPPPPTTASPPPPPTTDEEAMLVNSISSLTQAEASVEVPNLLPMLWRASEAASEADIEAAAATVVTVVRRSEADEDRGGGDIVDADMPAEALFLRPNCPKNCIPPEMMLPMLRLRPNRGPCSPPPPPPPPEVLLLAAPLAVVGDAAWDEEVEEDAPAADDFPVDLRDSSDLLKADGSVLYPR